MTPVPRKKNADTDRSVVSDVTIVRDSICEVLTLISSRRLLSRTRTMFSRIRSNTTMVSLIE